MNECSEGGHPAAWRAQDGALWFATLRGVLTMDRHTALANGMAPSVVVESLSVDDQTIDLKTTREIPPDHARLAFEYTGITFISPQRVRFRYMLEGFDRNWVDAGTRRTAYYTNLPPGEYRFRVAARANDGEWSPTDRKADVTFRLLPRFYQTIWFYLALALALGLAVSRFTPSIAGVSIKLKCNSTRFWPSGIESRAKFTIRSHRGLWQCRCNSSCWRANSAKSHAGGSAQKFDDADARAGADCSSGKSAPV